MYLKVLFFTCYNNIILIAIETHLLTFLKECINAIQRFWALQRVWSTIFQPRKAMVLLCALSLATHVASLLRSTAKTEAGLHDIAEAIEVMKEILHRFLLTQAIRITLPRRPFVTAACTRFAVYSWSGILQQTQCKFCRWQKCRRSDKILSGLLCTPIVSCS